MTNKKLLLVDNYDSFTYNLVHMLNALSMVDIDVRRNDEISVKESTAFDAIVVSPGPGIPSEAGLLKHIITANWKNKPMLGVCLGHQAIIEVLGGSIYNMDTVYHGLAHTMNKIYDDPILKKIPDQFEAGRYHSWVANRDDFPAELHISSVDSNERIMSFCHKNLPVFGMQFHPESVLTPLGSTMLLNFLNVVIA